MASQPSDRSIRINAIILIRAAPCREPVRPYASISAQVKSGACFSLRAMVYWSPRRSPAKRLRLGEPEEMERNGCSPELAEAGVVEWIFRRREVRYDFLCGGRREHPES